MLLTQSLLSPPHKLAGDLAPITAPNAQEWRTQAEVLTDENKRLRDEIERLKASQWQSFTATAYTADCAEGCSGITATGVDVSATTHINGARVIATDPSVIPLGTTVELRFSDGTIERAVASDTGGSINGHIIDYLVSDTATALQFGRQTVDIRKVEVK